MVNPISCLVLFCFFRLTIKRMVNNQIRIIYLKIYQIYIYIYIYFFLLLRFCILFYSIVVEVGIFLRLNINLIIITDGDFLFCRFPSPRSNSSYLPIISFFFVNSTKSQFVCFTSFVFYLHYSYFNFHYKTIQTREGIFFC